jgi:hypothetical protein
MKLALVLTNDWELFGDGSGDYFEIQHNPLLELLNLLDKYNAKISVMAEVFQQLKHIEYSFNDSNLQKIVNDWETILKETISRDHDVQLHIHPQWSEANIKDGKWQLSTNWAISKYSDDEIYNFLKIGKEHLEKIIHPIKHDYQCNVFRAGAYYIEPSEIVIRNLKKLNFKGDTSVTKGLISRGYFDFTDAESNVIPWFISEKAVKYKDDYVRNILELPIYSEIIYDSALLKKFFPSYYYLLRFGIVPKSEELTWAKERDRIKRKRYPVANRLYKQNEKKDLQWYMRTILSKRSIQLDYDYIPASIFTQLLKRIFNNKLVKEYFKKYEFLPVIASGHVKDMHSTLNIENILKNINNDMSNKVEYWTLTEALNYIRNEY